MARSGDAPGENIWPNEIHELLVEPKTPCQVAEEKPFQFLLADVRNSELCWP